MKLRNPRRYSVRHAVIVGIAVMLSVFSSFCFDFGKGDFIAGISSAAGYFVIFGLGVAILATIAGGITLLLGRLIGTTLTSAAALGLLTTLVITSCVASQPLGKFRSQVWDAAPASLRIEDFEIYSSFNDGTTYTFSIICDAATLEDLRLATNATKVSAPTGSIRQLLPASMLQGGTDYYEATGIEMAYIPSQQKVFIVRRPNR